MDNKKQEELKKIMPFKFRLGNWNKAKTKISVLGYIDSRDAQEKLDSIFGMDRSDDYKEIAGNLFCGVTIEGKTRWDCGVESNTEKEKGQASDSFKRACVKWGLGRFLYTLPNLTITRQEAEKNKYDITEFVKEKYKKVLKVWYDNFNSLNK